MKRGCFEIIALFVLAFIGINFVFKDYIPKDSIMLVSLGGAFLTVLVWGSLQNVFLAFVELSLIANAKKTTVPKNDRTLAITGRVEALSTKLISPFTGSECTMYEYEIYRMTEVPDSETSNGKAKKSEASGMAMVPSAVKGLMGAIKVLAWPQFKGFAKNSVDYGTNSQRILDYVNSTQFVNLGIKDIFTHVKDLFTEDDGSLKKDYKTIELNSIADSKFSEMIIPNGTIVTAIGFYSVKLGGLINNMKKNIYLTIYEGSSDKVAKSIKAKIFGYGFTTILFSGMLFGVLVCTKFS